MCMWNTTPNETSRVQVFKSNKGTLIKNNSINDKIFWLDIVFELIFVFLFSHHRNIRLFYPWKQVCRVYFHQAMNYEQIK